MPRAPNVPHGLSLRFGNGAIRPQGAGGHWAGRAACPQSSLGHWQVSISSWAVLSVLETASCQQVPLHSWVSSQLKAFYFLKDKWLSLHIEVKHALTVTAWGGGGLAPTTGFCFTHLASLKASWDSMAGTQSKVTIKQTSSYSSRQPSRSVS